MDEMKKLIIDGQEFEIVDAAGRDRITVLENTTPSGGGLSITEKNLILQLFNKAAYAEDDAGTAYATLSNLWTGSYHSVAWEGTGYTHGNSDVAVEDGESFTSTITANNGKTIESVTVTMGGETVQGAYSSGTITIPNVSGNIVITVTTAQMTVSSISAVYTQSGTVYDTDALDSLKNDLVVTATFPDSSTAVIDAADYTLSGTLLEGTSTITVSYGGKTTTFNVTVTEAPEVPLYPLPDITYSSSNNTMTVTDGNHITGHSVSNSRKYYICSDGTVGTYHNLNKAAFFTLAQGDTYELKVKNISFSENTVATNYINIGIVDSASTDNYVCDEQVSLTTTSEASGTPADVTVTGTISAASNINAIRICPYRSVTFTFDIELRINGTRYI